MLTLSLIVSAAVLSATHPDGWRALGEYLPSAPPQGSLYVADLHSQPGQEVLLWADHQLHCTSADGKLIWKSAPGLVSGAPQSLAATAETAYNDRLLAVAAGDALLVLDGETGEERWKETAGDEGLPWLAWADVDQQAGRELIAAAPGLHIRALSDTGLALWTYDVIDFSPDATLLAPMAWADVDGDAIPEGFGVTSQGYFRLSASGSVDWSIEADDALAAAPALAYDNSKGTYLVALVTRGGIYALDAGTGDPLWALPLEVAPKQSAHIVSADFDRDGNFDLAVATDAPEVVVVQGAGTLLWRQALEHAPVGLIAADANGDTRIDLLVQHEGAPLRAFQAGGLPQSLDAFIFDAPSALAVGDFNDDLMLDAVALCGKRMTALTSNLPAAPELLPWPMQGANAEQGRALAEAPLADSMLFDEEQDLARFGAFEFGAEAADLPGWGLEPAAAGTIALDTTTAFAGKGALGITPSAAATVYSQKFDIAPELRSVAIEIQGRHSGDARAVLEWILGDAVAAEAPLETAPADPAGWQRHALSATPPPLNADGFRLAIHSGATASTWDNFAAVGTFKRLPRARIHVAVAGYEYHSPKQFVFESNRKMGSATFALVDAAGTALFEGPVPEGARVFGAYGSDWGAWFAPTAFTFAAHQGKFAIRVEAEGRTLQSAPFEIQYDHYWNTVMPALWKPFLAPQDNPSSQWEAIIAANPDAAARILWRLATGYSATEWKSKAQAEVTGEPDRWRRGLAHGASSLAAPYFASPPADANAAVRIAAALARCARILEDVPFRDQLVSTSKTLLEARPSEPFAFELAVNLFIITQDPAFRAAADVTLPPHTAPFIDSMLDYESATGAMLSFPIMVSRGETADTRLTEGGGAFGIVTFNTAAQANYFNTPPQSVESKTQNLLLLEAALEMAYTCRFVPKAEYLDFAHNQHRWILGCNPADTVLLDTAGSGLLTRGFQGVAALDDTPRLVAADTTPLEQRLLENALFLEALSQLKRVPQAPPEPKA
ncbi:MAG: PQQ-binding-like beta-propeller repeat protein [Candidatus Hydrogenedentes bacterium]|nr:PQQ-binding-like beta-propeller repeat protein [Candidatus Hydrogenedentota bacterium]